MITFSSIKIINIIIMLFITMVGGECDYNKYTPEGRMV